MTAKEYSIYRKIKQFGDQSFTRIDVQSIVRIRQALLHTYLAMLCKNGKLERTGKRVVYPGRRGASFTEYKLRKSR